MNMRSDCDMQEFNLNILEIDYLSLGFTVIELHCDIVIIIVTCDT